jgi:hypothetical protein
MDNPISFKALSGLWVRSAESLIWAVVEQGVRHPGSLVGAWENRRRREKA